MAQPDFKARIVKPQDTKCSTTMLKGESGVGKTRQIGTLIEGGKKVLLLSVERKASTIQHLNPDLVVIEKYDFPATRAQAEAGTLDSDLWEAIRFLRQPGHGYDVVALDSGMRYFDEMANLLKTKLSGFEMWGAYADKGDAAIKKLSELADGNVTPDPVHVIITWGVEMGQDWKGQRRVIPLMDGKKLSPRIDYLFDNVLYLAKKEDAQAGRVDYAIYTAGTEEFTAKVSSAVKLPTIITNPNLFHILLAIEQGVWPPQIAAAK